MDGETGLIAEQGGFEFLGEEADAATLLERPV